MKEIRLLWNVVGRENIFEEPIQDGVWFPDNEVNRRDLEIIAGSGNEAYEDRSRRIEEREA